MNKIAFLLLTFTAYSAFAQDSVWDALDKRQSDLREVVTKQTPNGPVVVDKKEAVSSSKRAVCSGNTQESLPLAFVSRLFQEAPAKIDVVYEPYAGTLKLSTGGMIDNCSSLIKWNLDKISSGDKISYLVEAKFQKGSNCKVEGGIELCEYTVTEKVGIESKDKKIFVEPNHRGLEACLKETGIMSAAGINDKAIVTTKSIEEFSGVKESGDLLFVSTGKPLSNVKAKFGNYVKSEGCTNYENIAEKPIRLVSAEEKERTDKAELADKLIQQCTVNDYYKLTEFIDKYQDYEDQMVQVRNKLILKAVEKSAKAIAEGKYTDDDLKILADFEKYIVEPKAAQAADIYDELEGLEGDARKTKEAELKLVLAELTKLNDKPYFTQGSIQKLVNDGKFDEAIAVNSVKLTLQNHAALGSKIDKKTKEVHTPDSALVNIAKAKAQFAAAIEKEKEDYSVRTGNGDGQYKMYSALSTKVTSDMQLIQDSLYKKVQILNACKTNSYEAKQICNQGGGEYCYAGYFKNVNACVERINYSIEKEVKGTQAALEVLAKKGKDLATKAEHFKKLEAEGMRYVASQNGEEITDEQIANELKLPETPRMADTGMNTFQYNAQVAQGMAANNQFSQQQYAMSQQAYNPWGQFMGQSQQYPMANNFMGQANYQWNNGYNTGYAGMMNNGMAGQFTMNGGVSGMQYNQYGMNGMYGMNNGMMMGQQGGYWNNPYQAYGQFNMFAGR